MPVSPARQGRSRDLALPEFAPSNRCRQYDQISPHGQRHPETGRLTEELLTLTPSPALPSASTATKPAANFINHRRRVGRISGVAPDDASTARGAISDAVFVREQHLFVREQHLAALLRFPLRRPQTWTALRDEKVARYGYSPTSALVSDQVLRPPGDSPSGSPIAHHRRRGVEKPGDDFRSTESGDELVNGLYDIHDR